MPSPTTTKLRLLYERAERTFRIAKADKERAWLAYMEQMRAEGFCPNCEKPLQECKCVAMATGGYDIEPSALPYLVGQHTQPCIIPRSVAEKIQEAQAQWEEQHFGLPRVTIQITMPPVKPPRKDDL